MINAILDVSEKVIKSGFDGLTLRNAQQGFPRIRAILLPGSQMFVEANALYQNGDKIPAITLTMLTAGLIMGGIANAAFSSSSLSSQSLGQIPPRSFPIYDKLLR